MKFTRNFLMILSLSISLIGLALIYFSALNLEPRKIEISEITAAMEGRKIITTGYLTEKRGHENGHLFLTISDDNANIQVPLFSDFMKSLNQAGIIKDDFQIGDKISVKGTLEVYKGRLQIVPRALDDVKILGE